MAEALATNKYLKELYLLNNALCDAGIHCLANALRVNQGLKELSLVGCHMSDMGLEHVAKSLQHNNVLNKIYVWNDGIHSNRTTTKITPVLTECLQNNYSLTELWLPKNLQSSTASIEKAVNDVRKRSGLPLISVTGRFVPRTVWSYMYSTEHTLRSIVTVFSLLGAFHLLVHTILLT